MAYLDVDTWPRKAIFDFFRAFDDPWFNLTAEVDVTATRAWCSEHGASFSTACWYTILHATQQIDAFRQRMRPNGRVWQHDTIRIGATALRPDQTFTYVYYEGARDFPTFAQQAKQELARRLAMDGLEPEQGDDDLLHCTVVPWVRFTGIKHAQPGGDAGSVPKIALGRATDVGDSVWMPVSVEGHHALIDGVHVGRFFQLIEGYFAAPQELLASAKET